VIGIGLDLVDLERFRRVLDRTPSIVDRLFTDDERAYALAKRDPTERFAGRFAAKEAVMKAMGVGIGEVRFREIEVVRADSGAPSVALHGDAAARATGLGIAEWRLTLSHTHRVAEAIAVALGPSGSSAVAGASA
jgi:holo-[acyl-carrier protein] synthase